MNQVETQLRRLYPDMSHDDIAVLVLRVIEAFDGPSQIAPAQAAAPSSLRDDEVVLITYGDTFTQSGQPHLQSLGAFWARHLANSFTTLHVLPFFPSSSDGGFSIVDYRLVAEELGSWKDFELFDRAELMVDLVCNHGSAQSAWFADFVANREPGRSFYKTAHPNDDLGAVVRPRTHPLLVPVETAAGVRHVWATFSNDQVDFDFANPDVLVEFCSILGFYVAQGATRVRLDAIAYLWKEIGTSCVHLPETHAVVRLFRALLAARSSELVLITETNVPHDRNVSYFGQPDAGDEAHVVYNFTLAPLVVWSLVVGDAQVLTNWLGRLDPPPPGCAFLNFLASHDGLGLRPIEDLIDPEDLLPLVDAATAVGGGYSAYSSPDGPRPYELNVSLADLLAGVDGATANRFVVAHALMLAIQGIPAFYVHSMLVSPGDVAAVAATGHKRDINRARIGLDEAYERVGSGWQGTVFEQLTHLIHVRRACTAFGPQSPQSVHVLDRNVVALERGAGADAVFALHNMTGDTVTIEVSTKAGRFDVLTNELLAPGPLVLAPWQARWLTRQRETS